METLIIIHSIVGIVTNLAICAIIGAFGIGLYIRQKKQREALSRAKFGGNK